MTGEWSVVRIFGSNCLGSVAEMARAGAEIYCPVVRVRKRIGRMRSQKVEVAMPAYPGWAFMLTEPDPLLVRPWLRFRALELKITQSEIDRVKGEEAVWNANAADMEVMQKQRVALLPGDQVLVVAGLLKGQVLLVEEDLGSKVTVAWPGKNISSTVSLSPFLIEKIGA